MAEIVSHSQDNDTAGSDKTLNQYVTFGIKNESSAKIGFRNATNDNGWFYQQPGPYPGGYIDGSTYNDVVIQPGESYYQMNCYGTSGAASGANGSFWIINKDTKDDLGFVKFSCPYSSGYNNDLNISQERAGWDLRRPSTQSNGMNNYGFHVDISVIQLK